MTASYIFLRLASLGGGPLTHRMLTLCCTLCSAQEWLHGALWCSMKFLVVALFTTASLSPSGWWTVLSPSLTLHLSLSSAFRSVSISPPVSYSLTCLQIQKYIASPSVYILHLHSTSSLFTLRVLYGLFFAGRTSENATCFHITLPAMLIVWTELTIIQLLSPWKIIIRCFTDSDNSCTCFKWDNFEFLGMGKKGHRWRKQGGRGHWPPQKLSCGGIAPTKICNSLVLMPH